MEAVGTTADSGSSVAVAAGATKVAKPCKDHDSSPSSSGVQSLAQMSQTRLAETLDNGRRPIVVQVCIKRLDGEPFAQHATYRKRQRSKTPIRGVLRKYVSTFCG